jgi:hypothetical protein
VFISWGQFGIAEESASDQFLQAANMCLCECGVIIAQVPASLNSPPAEKHMPMLSPGKNARAAALA